jgi:hypothetical protein
MLMLKPIVVLLATGAVWFGATSLAGGAQQRPRARAKAVTIIAVLGRPVQVPAGQFRKAYAFCPRGYYVTGGGAYSGAIIEIASSPTSNLRGWFVDGTNNDPLKRTFQHRADAVCVKGSPSVPIGMASDGPQLRQAELDFIASHPAGGR